MSHILIVEDETKLAEVLRDYLEQSHYQVSMLHRGDQVDAWLRSNRPDLILLDIMLPGKDGLEICRDIRRDRQLCATPIILVTARVEEIDQLLGLELGADDYICKPFSPRLVVARVKSQLRRDRQSPRSPAWELDPATYHLKYRGKQVELTSVEFRLLNTLHERPGQIFSRAQLIERSYDDHRIVSDRTIDSHIKKIRRKLQGLLPEQDPIVSVYGVGYKLEMPAETRTSQ